MKNRILIFSIIFLFISIVSAQTIVTTFAGSTLGFVDGDTATATFRTPFGMCIDQAGNLFIADAENNAIRKISPDGIVTTFAGDGTAGYQDGPGSTAQFNSPSDLCSDADGNIYVSDFENQRIRKIDAGGNVSTIAGNGIIGYLDSTAHEAEFDYPRGIVMDSHGNLFVSDSWNHRIRKIDLTDSTVTTFAGGGNNMGVSSEGDLVDASDTSARFYTPSGLAIDQFDFIYVADAYNHRIRQIDTDGNVSTLIGTGGTGPGNGGYLDGTIADALLNTPTELFITPEGIIYIGDTYNNCVRKYESGSVTTSAGNTNSGYVDGAGDIAEFRFTRGVVLDPSGDYLFVCDYNNKRIRKIWLHVPVGVEELNSEINVFPNPSQGIIYITNQSSEAKSILVNDLLGERYIIDATILNDIIKIDGSNLLTGFYIVNIDGTEFKIIICKL